MKLSDYIKKKKARKRRYFSSKGITGFFKRNKRSKLRLNLRARFVARKYSNGFKVGVGVLAVFLASYFLSRLVLVSDLFKIDNIEIEGTKTYVSKEDISNLVKNTVYKKNILFVNLGKLEKTLEENFLGAKEIFLDRNFPRTISVTVIERAPLAIVFNEDLEGQFLIDEDGYVLGIVGEGGLSEFPKIKYEGDIKIGKFVDENIIPISAEVIKFTREYDLKMSSMSFHPQYSEVYVSNGVEVYIGNDKSVHDSIRAVAALIKKLSLEGRSVKKIDLRYDKVIVLYD